MFTIKPAKSFHGKFILPPSPDLFFLSAIISIASKQPVKISPFNETPLNKKRLDTIKGLADCKQEQNVCTIIPKSTDKSSSFVPVSYDTLPYRDIIVFTLLGMGKTIAFDSISERKIGYWKKIADKLGFMIESELFDDKIGLTINSFPEKINDNLTFTETDIAPFLGLLLGRNQDFSFNIDFIFSNPLRMILPVFGYELSVKSLIRKENDPIARRIKLIQSKRMQSSRNQKFIVTASFSKKNISEKPVEITLPGDEILGAILITSKCLLPKGSFVLNNMPLETWATPVLSYIRKMGCKTSIQETSRCSFGSVGMINIQKFELTGRKMECNPPENYYVYIPALVILAAFAKGQSVFRNMEDLRNDNPDGIDLIESCIRKLGARHGEMPDGIVVEGGSGFDGFDLTENYPAHISGSFCAAGFKCLGETHIEDENIKQRWPDFEKIISELAEFRS